MTDGITLSARKSSLSERKERPVLDPPWAYPVPLEEKINEEKQRSEDKSIADPKRSHRTAYLLLGLLYASLGSYFFTEREHLAENWKGMAKEVENYFRAGR